MNKMVLEKEIVEFDEKSFEEHRALFEWKDLEIVEEKKKEHYEMFKLPEKEQEILNYYDTHPLRMKGYQGDYAKIVKLGDTYYQGMLHYSFLNKDFSKGLSIHLLEGFSKEYLIKCAISNLKQMIKEKNLSLGDKKIIKDIAISAFNENLDKALNPHDENFSRLIYCVKVGLREDVRNKLSSYGFGLKKVVLGTMFDTLTGKRQRVRFLDLKQEDSENYFSRNTNL